MEKIGNEYKVEDIDLPVNIEKAFGGPWDDPWNLYRCSEQQKVGGVLIVKVRGTRFALGRNITKNILVG